MWKALPDVYLKATLLSHGVSISDTVFQNYGYPFLEKRRAYGNQDPLKIKDRVIPQELYTLPDKLIVAVNVKQQSKWKLNYDNGKYYITDQVQYRNEVTFPLRPNFYNEKLSSGEMVNQIITLYGGCALGIFVNGKCSLADSNMACHYCSILPNRSKSTEFLTVIRPEQVREALEIALQDHSVNIKQVMINGGNFKDLDKNFLYYANIVKVADDVIRKSKRKIDLHLIVFPPKNLSLFQEIRETSVGLIINMEVFDKVLFQKYCPGKSYIMGSDGILAALEVAAKILGKNRVFSVLVGGLESVSSLQKGMNRLAEYNVTPIINILHADPETPLENTPPPSVDTIIEMGQILQELYNKYKMKACYEDCGRNSIDTEAYRNLF